jgi:predicted ATP-grasp superfamily ATP-dependent carboligase
MNKLHSEKASILFLMMSTYCRTIAKLNIDSRNLQQRADRSMSDLLEIAEQLRDEQYQRKGNFITIY